MSPNPSTNVVIIAYSRASMTIERCSEVLGWSNLNRLIISIDGPRKAAPESELAWREETIRKSKELAQHNSNLEVTVHDTNSGLTSHVIRALTEGFKDSNTVILLEEDTSISQPGLDFLASTPEGAQPAVSAAYARTSHTRMDRDIREAFFPEQWGLAMNRGFFDEFLDVCAEKSVEAHLVEVHINKLLGSKFPILSRRASDYWSRLFRSALLQPNHTDAIFLYTAIRNGLTYRVPWVSLAKDVGHENGRGMHGRPKQGIKPGRHVPLGGSRNLCYLCELRNMRVGVLVGPRYWYEIAYRVLRVQSIDS